MPSKPHKSAAESPKLSASIILLHGQVHPLPAHLISTPTLFVVEEEMNVSSQAAGGTQKCVPHVLCSVSSVHLCSLFCCHLLSFVWFGFCACTTAPCNRIKDGAAQSYTPEPCILQCQGNGLGSFSIPAWWYFCLRSINQTAIAAQLHERKMAFEANKEEGKDIFRKCLELCHVEGCYKSVQLLPHVIPTLAGGIINFC